MVESNRDEERLARIEDMVERLQREQTALTVRTEHSSPLSRSPSDRWSSPTTASAA